MKIVTKLFSCIVLLSFAQSCKKKSPSVLPVASFTTNSTFSRAPTLVEFTNTSKNAISYKWEFGDGTTSMEISPKHVYTAGGTYNVKLTASDIESKSNQSIARLDISPAPTTFSSEQFIINSMSFPTQLYGSVFTNNYVYFIVDGTQISQTITANNSTLPITVNIPKMMISPLSSTKKIEVRIHWQYQASVYDMNLHNITVAPSTMVKVNDPNPYLTTNRIMDGSWYDISIASNWN
jgi:PKD repeat protein